MLFTSESKIAGYGLFTSTPIKKGEFVCSFGGTICTPDELRGCFDPDEQNYAVQFHPDYYLAPSDGLDSYVNHSCDPNCGAKIANFCNVSLYAVKSVAVNEEITFDYSTTQHEFWSIPCGCQAKNCRKKVENAEFLPRGLALKYFLKGMMPWYAFKSAMVDDLI